MQFSTNRIYPIVIVLLLILVIILGKGCNDKKLQIDSLNSELALKEDKYGKETKFWRDKYGNEHLTSERYRFEAKELGELTASLTKELGIKSKQVQTLSVIISETRIHKPLDVKYIYITEYDSISGDSITRLTELPFSYEDKWCSIDGIVCVDTSDCNDSINVNLNDTLTRVDYWKRKNIFSEKKYYVDISNKNPYIHLTGIKQLELANKEPKVLIAPFVGFGYGSNNIVDRNPYPQVAIGVCVVPYKFSIKIR